MSSTFTQQDLFPWHCSEKHEWQWSNTIAIAEILLAAWEEHESSCIYGAHPITVGLARACPNYYYHATLRMIACETLHALSGKHPMMWRNFIVISSGNQLLRGQLVLQVNFSECCPILFLHLVHTSVDSDYTHHHILLARHNQCTYA